MAEKHVFSIFKLADSVGSCRNRLLEKGFSQVATDDDSVSLFVKRTEPFVPKGLRGLSALASDPDWHAPVEIRVSAVAIFQVDGSAYVVTVGQVFAVIRDLLEPLFGIDIACRVLEPGTIITTGSTVFTGPVEHQDTSYRRGYDPREDWNSVSRLFKRMTGKLDSSKIRLSFGIEGSRGGEIRVHGSQGLRVFRAIDAQSLRTMLTHLDGLLARPPRVAMLSGAREVSHEPTRNLLWDTLANVVAAEFTRYSTGTINWDDLPLLSHQDPQFLTCDEYTLSFQQKVSPPCDTLTWDAILRFILRHRLEINRSTLDRVKIACWVEGNEVVRDSLSSFMQTDLSVSGKWYFLAHGRWYEHGQEFQDNVEAFLRRFIESDHLLPPRNPRDEDEDKYLEAAASKIPGLLMMHRTPVQARMELCDLLYAPSANVEPILIFVKRGTGQSVRDLAAQALESTVRFQHDGEFREQAILRVRAIPGGSGVRLEPGHFRVAMAILSEGKVANKQPSLGDLSVVARLNLCSSIQAIMGTGVRGVAVWLIPWASEGGLMSMLA